MSQQGFRGKPRNPGPRHYEPTDLYLREWPDMWPGDTFTVWSGQTFIMGSDGRLRLMPEASVSALKQTG